MVLVALNIDIDDIPTILLAFLTWPIPINKKAAL